LTAYESRKDRERARQAEQSRTGRDIGPLPKCKNKRRRARAEKSLRACCEVYFPGRFPLAWSDDHVEQLDAIERVVKNGGYQAIAAPRGDGKTTRLEIGVFWGVAVIAAHQYGVLLTATATHAPKRVGSLKTELLTNDLLLEDFPEIVYPIRCMAGIANRCAGMLLDGSPCWPGGSESPWARKRIVFPTVAGAAAGGAIIEASGLLEATRGLNYTRADGTVARPTIALIDDPQTDRSARSALQSEQREDTVAAGILHLPGPGRQLSALLSCTVIEPGDMADRMLDRSIHPEWHGIRKRLLLSFPAGCDPHKKEKDNPEAEETAKYWERYGEIYLEDLSEGKDGKRSTRYYKRHRKKMDRGAEAAWQHRKMPDEASAIEHSMRLFIRDRSSFFSEMQNQPEPDQANETVEMLTAKQIARRVSGYQLGEIPEKCERLTCFVDVHKRLLYYAVCAWESGFTGHVIEYGTWPHQTSTYFDLKHCRLPIQKHPEVTATTLEGQVTQAAEALLSELGQRTWTRTDGAEVALELTMFDANGTDWTDEIYAICRTARRRHGLKAMPTHGVAWGPAKKPMRRWDKKTVKGQLGEDWHIPPPSRGRSIRHVLIEVNSRKSFLHRRLATPPGDPGSLTLFHGTAARHRAVSEHLTAETGVKVFGPYGEMTQWKLTPNRDNHWLDCISNCATGESILGGKLANPKMKPADNPARENKPAAGKAKPNGRRSRVVYL